MKVLILLLIPLATLAQVNDIIVTANPIEPSLFESSDPVSVMKRDEILSRIESTLGETVDKLPGVRSSYFGSGASRPIIRGFQGDRVKILKNGVTTGDLSQISEDHQVTADPLKAQAIEVLRGSETLLYGSNAIGGVVNVIDNSILENQVGKEVSGEGILNFGDDADNERSFGVGLKGDLGELSWNLSGFYRETDDIKIPRFAESEKLHEIEEHKSREQEEKGVLKNSDTETLGYQAGVSQIWDKGFLGLAFSQHHSKYGIPGGHSHENHYEDDDDHYKSLIIVSKDQDNRARIDLDQYRIDLRGRFDDFAKNIESIKVKSGLSYYTHDEIEGGEVGTTYDYNTSELRVEAVHRFFGDGKGVFGVEGQTEDFSAVGEESFVEPTYSYGTSLFGFQEFPITELLKYNVGGRVEYINRDPLNQGTRDFIPVSFSTGPELKIGDDYLAGLSFAYTQRAPSTIELFADGVHLARGIYEIGDRNLNNEKSWGFDLSVKRTDGIITGGVTPFVQIFTDYINLTGSQEKMDDLMVSRYQNIEADFFGFEAEGKLHIDSLIDLKGYKLALEGQIDYVRAKERGSDNYLPRIPPLRTIGRLRYSRERFSSFIEGVFVNAQSDVAPFEIETEGYNLLNIQGEVKINENISLFLRGSNLTNEEARVHSSFLKDVAPLMGRAILLGLRAEF